MVAIIVRALGSIHPGFPRSRLLNADHASVFRMRQAFEGLRGPGPARQEARSDDLRLAPWLSGRSRAALGRSWTHLASWFAGIPFPILMSGAGAAVAAGHRSAAGCRRTVPVAPRPRPAGTRRSDRGARSWR